MGGYYPALAVRPPEPLGDQLTRAVQLRSLIGQQQMQQIQIQDMQAQTRAMQQWDGKDWNDYADLVRKNGGSGQTVMGINQHLLQQRAEHSIQIKNDAEAFKAKTEATQKIMDNAAAEIDNLKTLKPEDQAQGFEKAKQNIIGKFPEAADIVRGMQYNGPDSIDLYEKSLLGMSNYNKQLTEQAEAERARQQAAEAKARTAIVQRKAPFEIQELQQRIETGKLPTEASLAYKAAGGDIQSQQALKQLAATRLAGRPTVNVFSQNDAKSIADAIENGDQPPTVQGLYRNAGPVRAELARRGVPLAQMEMDWKAAQRYVQTLNGSQQVRLRQAISTASDSLDKIEGLYNEWQQLGPASGFKVLNHAALVGMKNLPGRPGAVAQALDAQIADLTSELGNVYMGGNSPTDHSLNLAKQNLSSDWNKDTFDEALKQARANLKIRSNSITHAMPAGLSGQTNYLPEQPATPPATPPPVAKATHRYNPATRKIEALP